MPRHADLSKARNRATNTVAAENILSLHQEDRAFIPLDKIGDRPSGDTRKLNDAHVSELVSSIAVIGLISPLTVDRKYRLLAGAHRRQALQILLEKHPERYLELFMDGVPVRVMNIDADSEPIDALQIEVEENTQRRNYTVAEIREAARMLEASGYERLRGRPAPGEKSLNRELMNVFRLSRRRITEILNEPERSEHPCSLLEDLRGYLRQTEKISKKTESLDSTKEIQSVQRDLIKLLKSLKLAIKQFEEENA
jgi:ParB family transcriptional regulator, chromosome partitioning protein